MKTLIKLFSTGMVAATLAASPAAFSHPAPQPHKEQPQKRKAAPKKAAKNDMEKPRKKNIRNDRELRGQSPRR